MEVFAKVVTLVDTPSAGLEKFDGLVKNPIYVVVGLGRQFAVPYVPSNCRHRHYTSYIKVFTEPILVERSTFTVDKAQFAYM